jgi:HEAT repeat protein
MHEINAVAVQRDGLTGKSIEELLLLVADAGQGCRRQAMDRILAMGLDAVGHFLERAVRDDDQADLRNGAMEVLVAFGELAVPNLVKLLKDDNEEVRNFSTVMLGDIGSRTAVEPLSEALRDPEANVRHGAAEALGKIGDYRAVEPLREMTRSDFWDSFYALAALSALGGETVATGRP